MSVSRLGLFGLLLLSWWAGAGAVFASDAVSRDGARAGVVSQAGRDAPVWLDNGRSPIASAERRGGGPSGAPPTRAAVVHSDVPARAGVFRPAFGVAVLPSELVGVSRGRQTRAPPGR